MKLKFQLAKFERGLAFQVLEQNDLFLNKDGNSKITFEDQETKLKIVSNHLPKFDLNNFELHLRGSQEENNFDIPSTKFENNDMRDEWFEYILNSIKIWARTCSSFEQENQEQRPTLKRKGNIFEI